MKKSFESKDSIPYQEFIGKYLDFFDENGEIIKFEIRKIRNNCFVLRKKEEGKISDLEIPIIEVLTLNFPNSESYVFSKEEWINFWLKYGGYLPPQIKIDKDFLSIKEAREIFSKLPSEFEKILFYFFFPNKNIYELFLKIKEQPDKSDIEVSIYFKDYADSETIKKIVYLLNLFRGKLKTNEISIDELVSLERENSIKREKFFGRKREPELYNDEEKKDFSKLISDLNYLMEVRNFIVRLDREFYDEIEKIEENLALNKAFISRSLSVFFKDLVNYYSFPLYFPEIYSEKYEISSKEARIYFLVLIIKKLPFDFIKELIESSISIEEFILKTFLKEYGLEKILKFKPKFIITPPTNAIPIAYFYRNLIKFTNIILKANNSQLSEQIIPPKFILFDFIDRNEWNYFKDTKINNQISCLYFLNLFKLYSLEEIKTKAELNEFNLEKNNLDKLKLIINKVQRVIAKIKKIEDFNNINNIDDFKELINKICFLDDTLSSGNTYFYSMYIFYLALMNVFKEKINPDEIYECLKQRFLVDFENLTNSYTKVDRPNEVTIFTQTDILREFIPFLKLKLAEINQSFTYYPGFRYEELEKYFPAELLKEIKKFSNFKIKFLKEISKLLAPYLAQIIKEF